MYLPLSEVKSGLLKYQQPCIKVNFIKATKVAFFHPDFFRYITCDTLELVTQFQVINTCLKLETAGLYSAA